MVLMSRKVLIRELRHPSQKREEVRVPSRQPAVLVHVDHNHTLVVLGENLWAIVVNVAHYVAEPALVAGHLSSSRAILPR